MFVWSCVVLPGIARRRGLEFWFQEHADGRRDGINRDRDHMLALGETLGSSFQSGCDIDVLATGKDRSS